MNTKHLQLKEKLQDRSCIGIFSKTTDSAFVEAAGLSSLDFIILDTEHGPANWETIHHHVRAAALTPMASIVRVAGVNSHLIGMALDTGADGVQVPNIANATQASQAIQAARFYPKGERGVCRFVRAAGFGEAVKSVYFEAANEALLVLQVEGIEGVENIDAILAVPGFDVLFVGPYDLSQSIGRPGEVESREVLALIERIASATTAAGKRLGIFCDTPDALARYRGLHVPYLSYSVDVSLFRDAVALLAPEK
jgi:4-hydroxy-2-oxoheptanedioate aldolase